MTTALNFGKFSVDLQIHSFSFLDFKSIMKGMTVSKDFNNLLNSERVKYIWERFYKMEKEHFATAITTTAGYKEYIKNKKALYNFCTGNVTTRTALFRMNTQELDTLPAFLGHVTWLQNLNISGNKIASLPESMSIMTNLTCLDISDNCFAGELPKVISSLVSLQNLDAHNNRLTHVSEAFSEKLSLLERCNLSNNRLTSLSETIGRLTGLRFLDLSKNPHLCRLPASFFNLNLTQFSLDISKLDCVNTQFQVATMNGFMGNEELIPADPPLLRHDSISQFPKVVQDTEKLLATWGSPSKKRRTDGNKLS